MDLTVLHRLLLLGMLPAEGDITMLRIVRKLREELSFSEQEHAEVGLAKLDDGRVTWTDTTYTKTVDIGPKAHALIVDVLTKASAAKTLTANHLGLCDLFGIPDTE
jgi:hypothetical protein